MLISVTRTVFFLDLVLLLWHASTICWEYFYTEGLNAGLLRSNGSVCRTSKFSRIPDLSHSPTCCCIIVNCSHCLLQWVNEKGWNQTQVKTSAVRANDAFARSSVALQRRCIVFYYSKPLNNMLITSSKGNGASDLWNMIGHSSFRLVWHHKVTGTSATCPSKNDGLFSFHSVPTYKCDAESMLKMNILSLCM